MFFKKPKKEFGSSYDYMFVGLGNPGREYEATRHNAGFLSLDTLAEKYDCQINKLKFKSLIGECKIGDKRVLLVKPQTFMNNSGEAVRDAAAFYKIPPERTVIIFDDISLPPGKLRLRRKGSDGGHNGMKNIIYLSGSDAFMRIKFGVGAKPHPDYDLKDWVLSRFKKDEEDDVKKGLSNAAAACETIIKLGIDEAMNRYNNK